MRRPSPCADAPVLTRLLRPRLRPLQEKRLEFLLGELKGKRPLMPPGMEMSPEVHEVVATFR